MARHYAAIAFTDRVKAAQSADGSREGNRKLEALGRADDRLGDEERAFIAARDTFFLATVNEAGWPYVQLRGGPPGFVHALDERTLAYADFRGNRQLLSVGNLAGDDRVAAIFVDFAARERLKIFARATVVNAEEDPVLIARLAHPAYPGRVERAIVLHVAACDWNCHQHIVPRYTEDEVAALTAPLRARIAELERAAAAR